MWETILIAVIPAIVTMTLTNIYNRKKYKIELERLVIESKGSEAANMQAILQNYNLALTQTKVELADVNERFSSYIEEANKKALMNKNRILKLEKDNRELSAQVALLTKDMARIMGVTEEELFDNIYKDTNTTNDDTPEISK